MRIAFHATISQTFELFSYFGESTGRCARGAPVTAQAFGLAQPFTQLCGKLAVIAPVNTILSPLG